MGAREAQIVILPVREGTKRKTRIVVERGKKTRSAVREREKLRPRGRTTNKVRPQTARNCR